MIDPAHDDDPQVENPSLYDRQAGYRRAPGKRPVARKRSKPSKYRLLLEGAAPPRLPVPEAPTRTPITESAIVDVESHMAVAIYYVWGFAPLSRRTFRASTKELAEVYNLKLADLYQLAVKYIQGAYHNLNHWNPDSALRAWEEDFVNETLIHLAHSLYPLTYREWTRKRKNPEDDPVRFGAQLLGRLAANLKTPHATIMRLHQQREQPSNIQPYIRDFITIYNQQLTEANQLPGSRLPAIEERKIARDVYLGYRETYRRRFGRYPRPGGLSASKILERGLGLMEFRIVDIHPKEGEDITFEEKLPPAPTSESGAMEAIQHLKDIGLFRWLAASEDPLDQQFGTFLELLWFGDATSAYEAAQMMNLQWGQLLPLISLRGVRLLDEFAYYTLSSKGLDVQRDDPRRIRRLKEALESLIQTPPDRAMPKEKPVVPLKPEGLPEPPRLPPPSKETLALIQKAAREQEEARERGAKP